MYRPSLFDVSDRETLHVIMQRYAFATLISFDGRAPFATHLPVHYDAASGDLGTLYAHLARANPQHRFLSSDHESLLIFQGPHAYISPSWYETHPAVPTWNYVVVHAYGMAKVMDDNDKLRAHVQSMVTRYEANQTPHYQVDDEYVDKLLPAIVGIELPITRLEGKCKLSQNRPLADQRLVVSALDRSTHAMDHELAEWMRQMLTDL